MWFSLLVKPNRGKALFAQRMEKSEEWIIDDVAEQVIDAARDKLFRNIKQSSHSVSSSPIPPPQAYSRLPPIAGPTYGQINTSLLPPSRPASAMASLYSCFKDFNSRPKPFCRAYWYRK